MERILKTVKSKKKRETFPDTVFSSLKRGDHVPDDHESPVDNKQDFHEMENYPKQTRLPQYTIDDLNQREIAERRKNFAITRSKSFALPVGHQQAYSQSNASFSSVSRKSSFSSLLSKNGSLSDRSMRVSSDVNLRRDPRFHEGWHSKDLLYQV